MKPPTAGDFLLLVIAVICLWAAASPGAVITGQLTDIFLEPHDSPLLFTPASNVTAHSGAIYAGPPRVALTTNGVFHLTLAPGPYQVSFPLVPNRLPMSVQVPDTNSTFNLTELVQPNPAPETLQLELDFYASDLAYEIHTRTQISAAPLSFPDVIALHSTATGNVVAHIPEWATQAVSQLLFQWSGANPLHWTNTCRAFALTDPAGPASVTAQTFSVLLTNHLNCLWFTNSWFDGHRPKYLALTQPAPPTNTLHPVFLLRWSVHLAGTNKTDVP